MCTYTPTGGLQAAFFTRIPDSTFLRRSAAQRFFGLFAFPALLQDGFEFFQALAAHHVLHQVLHEAIRPARGFFDGLRFVGLRHAGGVVVVGTHEDFQKGHAHMLAVLDIVQAFVQGVEAGDKAFFVAVNGRRQAIHVVQRRQRVTDELGIAHPVVIRVLPQLFPAFDVARMAQGHAQALFCRLLPLGQLGCQRVGSCPAKLHRAIFIRQLCHSLRHIAALISSTAATG